MFCIVEFAGGRKRTVVPDTWLSINDTLCLLPPKATDSDLEVLVRNLTEPGEGWQMLEVNSLETFESYSEAKKQLKKSKEMLQLETSSQRKRKKPSYLENYATYDSDDGRPYTVFRQNVDKEAISENEWIPPPESSPHIKNVTTVKKTIRNNDHRTWNHRFSQSQLSSQKENIDIICGCQSSCHSTFLQVLHSMQKQLNRTNQMVQQLLGGQKQTHSQLKRILQSRSVNQMNGQEEMDVFSLVSTRSAQSDAKELVLPTLENSREDVTSFLPTISPRTQPLTQEASTSNQLFQQEVLSSSETSNKKKRVDDEVLKISNFPPTFVSRRQSIQEPSTSNEIFKQKVSGLFEELKAGQDELRNMLAASKVISVGLPLDCPALPVNTHEDLQRYDKYLDERSSFSQTVTYFGTIGGSTYSNTVRRILQMILTNNLSQKYNWKGTGAVKLAFCQFKNVLKLITTSIRQHECFEKITDQDIENVVKKWLVHSKDRDGGRSLRKR